MAELNARGKPKGQPGRPKGGINRKSSKLRKTERSFHEMNEEAVKIVKASLDGKEVDEKKLTTAKWVITTTISLSKNAISEEQVLNAQLLKNRAFNDNEDDVPEEEEENKKAVVSFSVVKKQ